MLSFPAHIRCLIERRAGEESRRSKSLLTFPHFPHFSFPNSLHSTHSLAFSNRLAALPSLRALSPAPLRRCARGRPSCSLVFACSLAFLSPSLPVSLFPMISRPLDNQGCATMITITHCAYVGRRGGRPGFCFWGRVGFPGPAFICRFASGLSSQ